MTANSRVWKPLELVETSAAYLKKRGVPSARHDAELLLADVLGLDRLQLYLQFERPLIPAEIDTYRSRIQARGQRHPLQLLLGTVQVLDHEFRVAEGVFVPRPETESLILVAQECSWPAGPPQTIVEVGVGTGCVGLSLLAKWPNARLVGYDVNPRALQLAMGNAELLQLDSRADLRSGDAFQADIPPCDLIVSNPPYIPTGDLSGLDPEVQHDPKEALDGGADGLDAIRKLVNLARCVLKSRGWLVFEHGFDQGEACRGLAQDAGLTDVAVHADLAGHPRVTVGRQG